MQDRRHTIGTGWGSDRNAARTRWGRLRRVSFPPVNTNTDTDGTARSRHVHSHGRSNPHAAMATSTKATTTTTSTTTLSAIAPAPRTSHIVVNGHHDFVNYQRSQQSGFRVRS